MLGGHSRAVLLAVLGSACGPQQPPPAPPEPEPAPTPEPPEPPPTTFTRHPAAAVELEVPEGWAAEKRPPLMTLLAPDDGMLVLLLSTSVSKLEVAMQVLDEQLSKVVERSTLSELREGELGGMTTHFATGTGTMGKTPIVIEVALVESPDAHVLVVLGLAPQGDAPAVVSAVEGYHAMVASMRPASDDATDTDDSEEQP